MIKQITVIEYWRRTMDGREYCSNRLFWNENIAKGVLLANGYKLIEDDLYAKNDMRALLTTRTIE